MDKHVGICIYTCKQKSGEGERKRKVGILQSQRAILKVKDLKEACTLGEMTAE